MRLFLVLMSGLVVAVPSWGQEPSGAVLDARIERMTALRQRLDACIGCGCLSLQSCKLYNPDDIAAEGGPGPRVLR